ncbi:MAG: efflux RND transporter periplasmic adaptor subunit [Akkermansiaceae bacterium]|jgi:RND family efflux transporter MFP subunit|nr:efflux RND transporter periplasmic adaptor subunit [Akkermansiaceae bacterium]
MKRNFRILIAVAIFIAGLGSFFLLAKLKKTPLPANPPKPFQEVETITARKADLQVSIPAQGTIEPATLTRAAAEVEGTVIAVSPEFEAGGNFKAGDVLLEIDPSDYKAALAQAEASLADAKLAVVQEEMKAEQAKRDWERIATPGQQPNDLVLRIPQLAAARARVDAAQAAVEKAIRDLERTKLRAPYDGRIRRKLVDLGTHVGKGTGLAEFYATGSLEVRLPIPRQDAAFFDPAGQEITLHETGGQKRSWKAVIDRTEGEIQRENRSIVVVARIDGSTPDAPLPGQFVHTHIAGRTLPDLVRVPRRAFVKSDRVMVVGDGHTVTTREVKILRTEKEEVLVSEGIEDGEQLCVTALTAVIEGMEVKVVSRDGKEVKADTP